MKRKHHPLDRRKYVHVRTVHGVVAILASHADYLRTRTPWIYFRAGAPWVIRDWSYDYALLLRLPDSFIVR